MTSQQAIESLRELVVTDRARIVRLWAKRLRQESHEVEVAGRDLRAPLDELLGELIRLLEDRGEDALLLWPEAIRSHGVRRYEQRFDADDLIREFKVLQQVLLEVYARRFGGLPVEFAVTISELVGEATASVEASFARVLRTEEVRFRDAAVMESVLHYVDVGIMVVEVDGTVSYVTPPVQRLLGVPVRVLAGAASHQVLAPVLAQINAHHPSGEPFRHTEMPFVRALKEKRPVRRTLMVVETHRGEERFLELNATPLFSEDEDRELIGVIQTVVDRTDTAQKNRELSHAYDELRRLQGRLLQRSRTQALGQLASGTAHALNNFLNVLRLRLTLLRREFKPDHLDALERSMAGVGDLVSRLQEFSGTRSDEELNDVPVEAVLREALQQARPDFPGNLVVETRFAQRGHVRVDPGYFRELLVNLLLTARHRASDKATLRIEEEVENGSIIIRLRMSGPPFSEDQLQTMFDPLKSKAAPLQSLLLGLARHQMQRWDGELQAQNVEGGVEFVLCLPEVEARQTQEAAARTEPPRPRPRPFQQTRRVLVVDDEAENARMLAHILTEEGYQVQVAETARDALSLWGSSRFDAALLDVMMPDSSGFELARQMRAQSPHALLAVVTGADVRGQNRANLALVDAVFRKPLDVEALDDFLSQTASAVDEENTPVH